MLIAVSVRAVPVQRICFGSRADVVGLLKFGGWLTVSNVVGPLLVFTDRFAIGAILGTAAVSLYTVPYNVAWQITIIPSSLSSALFPKFASITREESKHLINKAVSALSFFMTPATIAAVALAPPLLVLWLGSSIGVRSAPVACILLFGLWANAFGRIAYCHLQASGRPNTISKLVLAELLPYLAMLYFGMRWMGLPGAAVAWSLRCSADTVGLFFLDQIPVPAVGRLAAQTVLVGVAVVASIDLPIFSVSRLATLIVLCGVAVILVWRGRPANLEQLLPSDFREGLLRSSES
jgi:O-antigen/teichoic acid export membrane protein